MFQYKLQKKKSASLVIFGRITYQTIIQESLQVTIVILSIFKSDFKKFVKHPIKKLALSKIIPKQTLKTSSKN